MEATMIEKCAVLAFSKFMTISSKFCDQNINKMMMLLKSQVDP